MLQKRYLIVHQNSIDTSQICFNKHEQRLEIEAGYER